MSKRLWEKIVESEITDEAIKMYHRIQQNSDDNEAGEYLLSIIDSSFSDWVQRFPENLQEAKEAEEDKMRTLMQDYFFELCEKRGEEKGTGR